MKVSKPKGKTPSLIGGSLGGARNCVVERTCSCNRCNDSLSKGTQCHEIAQLGGSFASYKRYCNSCYREILEKTKADLEKLILEITLLDAQ